jgi:zinc protease
MTSPKLRAALLIATAIVPTTAFAQSTPKSAASLPVAPLHYGERTLANGLRVYSIPDPSSPTVSVQVWYNVGGKDDPAGRSGFAHLFEHMMFKATRNMASEQFDRLTEDVGGFNNAGTNDDYTNYYEGVPANHLQRLLWAEAERMGSLVVDPAVFASERDVVKEELRSRVLAQPYGKLFYIYRPEVSYSVHPYARSVIGSIEDLDAATIDDVRAFHATYYRPDNAVLVVAGRFDQAQLDRWVDQYFTPIARPSTAIPRVKVTEPPRTGSRTYTVYEPNTPLPAVLLSYPLPPAYSDDAVILEVANAVLSSGRSSRLYQSLVYTKQIASQADSFADLRQGQGVLAPYAILATGKTAEEGEVALRAEVARLAAEPVTAAELAEAKNELLTSALRDRERADGKAGEIASAVTLAGDPRAADRRLARIARTTAADIQRVARIYLADGKAAVIRYLPETAGQTPKEDVIGLAPTVRTAALKAPANIATFALAPIAERIAPPSPGPEIPTAVPRPIVDRLANGLTVITVPRKEIPLATALLVSDQGAAGDPDGKAGLALLTSQLTTKGTATRSATQIASSMEALGGTLNAGADYDGSNIGVTVMSAQLSPALAILADVARHPTFAADEIERQRAINIDDVNVEMQDPGYISQVVGGRALYGAGAYGAPIGGTQESLKGLTRDDVTAAYQRGFGPDRSTLILTGDVDAATAKALASQYFGDWKASGTAPQPRAVAGDGATGRLLIIDMPDAGQAAVAVLRPGIARSDPLFYAAAVANDVLGGGYSSRLNQEIRIKRGLSYGASSILNARREAGPEFATAQTKNESAPEVLGLILGEMQQLGAQPIPVAELGTRKAALTGSFGRGLESTSSLANMVRNYVLRGVSLDEMQQYQQAVNAVTPGDAAAAAAKVLAPAGATVVIVGDGRKFLDRLRTERGEVTVIPLSKLDLVNLPKPLP